MTDFKLKYENICNELEKCYNQLTQDVNTFVLHKNIKDTTEKIKMLEAEKKKMEELINAEEKR